MNDSLHLTVSYLREEIVYLATDTIQKLSEWNRFVSRFHLDAQSGELPIRQANAARVSYEQILSEISQIKFENNEALRILRSLKETLRTLQHITGSILTAYDWQSQPYSGSFPVHAGVQTGIIEPTLSDYKRVQHFDEKPYEAAWKREYIPFTSPFSRCYTVSSGMAGCTTLLVYIQQKLHGYDGPILVGKRTYFELADLLKGFFPNRIVYIDEAHTTSIIDAIRVHKPRLIVLDSYPNVEDIVAPEIVKIYEFLNSWVKTQTYLFLDTSSLPLSTLFPQKFRFKSSQLSVVGIESLIKYHQFGMDRVNGGMIWTWGMKTGEVFEQRFITGTNIGDAEVQSLPTPNRILMCKRLHMINVSCKLLRDTVNTSVGTISKKHKIQSLHYPVHAGYSGGFLTVHFAPQFQSVTAYTRFIDAVMMQAKKRGVQIIGGTSFGFDTTRIYLTALHATDTVPFVRIAPGIETTEEIQRIAEAIIAASRI